MRRPDGAGRGGKPSLLRSARGSASRAGEQSQGGRHPALQSQSVSAMRSLELRETESQGYTSCEDEAGQRLGCAWGSYSKRYQQLASAPDEDGGYARRRSTAVRGVSEASHRHSEVRRSNVDASPCRTPGISRSVRAETPAPPARMHGYCGIARFVRLLPANGWTVRCA